MRPRLCSLSALRRRLQHPAVAGASRRPQVSPSLSLNLSRPQSLRQLPHHNQNQCHSRNQSRHHSQNHNPNLHLNQLLIPNHNLNLQIRQWTLSQPIQIRLPSLCSPSLCNPRIL